MRTVLATLPPTRVGYKHVLRTHFRVRTTTNTTTVAGGVRAYKEIPQASVLSYLLSLVKNGTSMPVLQTILEDRITQCVRTHGLLYRDSVPHFSEYVMVLDPRDIELIWRAEGRWPQKADFFSGVLKDARKDRQKLFVSLNI